MSDLTQRIQTLRTEIEKQLRPLIDNNYVYIDLPLYANIGDTLIWEGTKEFLRQMPFKCLGKGSTRTWLFPKLSPETIILMQGGGNFGDLYPTQRQFRLDVIERYPHNKIILLPQSIYYQSQENQRRDTERMRRHNKLHLCARDQAAHNLLRKYFRPEQIRLVPDMAFCIDHTRLRTMLRPAKHPVLLLKRTDKELVTSIDYTRLIVETEGNASVETHDWPTMERKKLIVSEMKRMTRHPHLFDQRLTMWFAEHVFRPYMVRQGVNFIGRYDRIYTTRLHAAILAILLGREVTLIDNIYGKNSNFFNTWFVQQEIRQIGLTPAKPESQASSEQEPKQQTQPAKKAV